VKWRNSGWSERVPRPKVAKLPKEQQQRLHTRAVKFIKESIILHKLVGNVQLARGRLYLWRGPENLMARITPLSPRLMLLEAPHRNSWTEHKRGQLATVLRFVETDTKGTFHGLGSLVTKKSRARASAQVILHRDLKIPVRVLSEPRYWYSMHREPVIAEVDGTKKRALVRFVALGMSGAFHGTCLYALRHGEWGCYTIKPSASENISTAETWLDKRNWEEWG
jgi:hypothetical protein